MTDHLLESFEQGVTTLTMNRPEARNAMSGAMMSALHTAVARAAADPKVRCLVLTGAGGAFCAGGDVKGQARAASDRSSNSSRTPVNIEARVQGLRSGMELTRLLHEMPKPTLAVIPGAAAGAGLSLALACDLRVALSSAKLTTAFAKIGASGDYGGSYFLPRLVGAAKARELYFTADVISGEEAARLGLVNYAYPAETFAAEAQQFALRLAALPTIAIGYMKKNLNAADHAGLADVLDLEAAHMVRTMMTEDHARAAQAFVDKQPPRFEGS
ncbi:MAG: enoyl-CoA hydratase-related protein [Pseudomonadales bacterium]|nr:enoyl-CoA hydratase/isomerase family protein [Pseudomonadales bacterium]